MSNTNRTLVAILLFIVALSVRLPDLGGFLTFDEEAWIQRSQTFLSGLLKPTHLCGALVEHSGLKNSQGLECTLRTGHPGITTMWTGSLGIVGHYLMEGAPGTLFEFTTSLQTNPIAAQLIAPTRLPTVIITSLWVMVIYLLLLKLFHDARIALIAGLLLALDPFHIAHSRVIHHDALVTTFVSLSLILGLIYGCRTHHRAWLIASGIMAGLAFLSKSTAVFLFPFVGLIALQGLIDFKNLKLFAIRPFAYSFIRDYLIWFVSGLLTIFLVWPAMWVMPLVALSTVFSISQQYAAEGHAHFWFGKITLDPGPIYYPLSWLLRSTPLTWLGLLGLMVCLIRKPGSLSPETIRLVTFLAIFIGLFLLFMTLGAKKQDRYILPIYPLLNLIAAVGLVGSLDLAAPKISPIPSSWLLPLLAGFILIGQGLLVINQAPYYFTYYNPLLGGVATAQQFMTVGWGEGMDLVADYLNQQPQADQLKVTARYHRVLMPFFQGQYVSVKDETNLMDADYMVYYINQIQRDWVDKNLLLYHQRHYNPAHVVTLHGVDYALIYPIPIEHRLPWEMAHVPGQLNLYGYRQHNDELQLVWQNQAGFPEVTLWTALTPHNQPEQPIQWQPCQPAEEFSDEEAHQLGAFVESRCPLISRSVELYRLHFGIGLPDGTLKTLTAPGGIEQIDTGKFQLLTPKQFSDRLNKRLIPPQAKPLAYSYSDIVALVGQQVEQTDNTIHLSLYWQPFQEPLPDGLEVRFRLTNSADELLMEIDQHLFLVTEKISKVIVDQYQLEISKNLPTGVYYLRMALGQPGHPKIIPFRDDVTGELKTEYFVIERIVK